METPKKLRISNRSCSIWASQMTFHPRLQSKNLNLTNLCRDLSGKNFFSELAKEVEKFTMNVIDKFGGVLALVDLYCMYNIARGTDMISPEDLLIACEKLNSMAESKLILRTFSSGVKVV